jgi:hypothetical protein
MLAADVTKGVGRQQQKLEQLPERPFRACQRILPGTCLVKDPKKHFIIIIIRTASCGYVIICDHFQVVIGTFYTFYLFYTFFLIHLVLSLVKFT